MDSTALAALAGILLSLGFSYIPGLNSWYGAQSEQIKRLVMLGLVVLGGVGAFALSCYGPYTFFECSEGGFWALVEAIGLAVATNQGTYGLTKKVK